MNDYFMFKGKFLANMHHIQYNGKNLTLMEKIDNWIEKNMDELHRKYYNKSN